MAYFGLVTNIKNVKKDENSNNLYLGECFSEGVIIGPDMKEGDLILYLPQDGKIERWFGNEFNLFRKNLDGTPQGGYIEDNGHIRAIKLRGNQSSGVVISLNRVYEKFGDQHWMPNDKVVEINGKIFCSKYIPKNRYQNSAGRKKTSYKGRKAEGIKYPEFSMHSDTQQLAYNLNAFKPGDIINLSLKMHGSSSRHMRTYAELPRGFWRRLFHMKAKTKPVYVCGTRRCVVTGNSQGYYGNDEFRLKWHRALGPYIEDGVEVYGEIVGYYGPNENDTIMPIADNAKMNDKNFIKKYGKRTIFSYGCKPGENELYIYRITSNNGEYEFTPEEIIAWCDKNGFKHVPYIDTFEFTTIEDLQNRINTYFEDLTDPIGGDHIKEGVVVRIVNRRTWQAYKSKTFEFKVLSGLAIEGVDTRNIAEDVLEEM